jgi:hypothetical protein
VFANATPDEESLKARRRRQGRVAKRMEARMRELMEQELEDWLKNQSASPFPVQTYQGNNHLQNGRSPVQAASWPGLKLGSRLNKDRRTDEYLSSPTFPCHHHSHRPRCRANATSTCQPRGNDVASPFSNASCLATILYFPDRFFAMSGRHNHCPCTSRDTYSAPHN